MNLQFRFGNSTGPGKQAPNVNKSIKTLTIGQQRVAVCVCVCVIFIVGTLAANGCTVTNTNIVFAHTIYRCVCVFVILFAK